MFGPLHPDPLVDATGLCAQAVPEVRRRASDIATKRFAAHALDIPRHPQPVVILQRNLYANVFNKEGNVRFVVESHWFSEAQCPIFWDKWFRAAVPISMFCGRIGGPQIRFTGPTLPFGDMEADIFDHAMREAAHVNSNI